MKRSHSGRYGYYYRTALCNHIRGLGTIDSVSGAFDLGAFANVTHVTLHVRRRFASHRARDREEQFYFDFRVERGGLVKKSPGRVHTCGQTAKHTAELCNEEVGKPLLPTLQFRYDCHGERT